MHPAARVAVAELVERAETLHVALKAHDANGAGGGDDKDAAFLFEVVNVVAKCVVTLRFLLQLLRENGVGVVEPLDESAHSLRRLAVGAVACAHDDNLFKALIQRPIHRNFDAAPAIQIWGAVNIDHFRGNGYARGGLNCLGDVLAFALFKIACLARDAVGGHRNKAALGPVKALLIEGQNTRDVVEEKVKACDAAILPQSLVANVAAVVPVGEVDATRAADLAGNVVEAVHRPGGDADGALQIDIRLHEPVEDAGSVNAAKGPALKDDTARRHLVGGVSDGQIFNIFISSHIGPFSLKSSGFYVSDYTTSHCAGLAFFRAAIKNVTILHVPVRKCGCKNVKSHKKRNVP